MSSSVRGFGQARVNVKPFGAPAVKLTPAKGGIVLEHGFRSAFSASGFRPMQPPQKYVFPNTDQAVKHLVKTVHFPWEGGKSGRPKPRGAAKAHRERQIETTGYPSAAKMYSPTQGSA